MRKLTTKEKLKKVLQLCQEHNITPYQIGKDTELNKSGIQRIFNGEVANPRPKTVSRMLEYVENKISEEKYGKSPKSAETGSLVNESIPMYNTSIEGIVASRVVEHLDPYMKEFQKDHNAIFRALTDNSIDIDEIKDSLEELKTKLNSLKDTMGNINKSMTDMHEVVISKK